MIWVVCGVIGFSLLLAGGVAADRRVAEWLGLVGAILATTAFLGGMLTT